MTPIETYLQTLHNIHGSNVDVASTVYHDALARLLNKIGQSLKPRVISVLHLKTVGGDLPSGGFFTADQLPSAAEATSSAKLPTTPPGRGVIELLRPDQDPYDLVYGSKAHEEYNIGKHLKRYGLVLVTNYWSFVLLALDDDGQPVEVEGYHLADDESDFWNQATQSRYMAQIHTDRFIEFLKRAMLYAAPLATLETITWFLASYAREANSRMEQTIFLAADTLYATTLLQALDDIRLSLEATLGVTFDGEKGNQFFRLSLIQTLFYSIFSAWVLWHYEDQGRQDRFDWKLSHWYLRLSLIYALFRQLTQPDLAGAPAPNLNELFTWAGNLLNRADRTQLFESFEAEQHVDQFCELFMQTYSPQLCKVMGVWYTPPEIAQHMAARVDTVLREVLEIPDGLANETVRVLDPCCGTGTFLFETLKQIAATLQTKGDEALRSYYVKKAALKRIFGFEIMPASFIIAHLKLSLLLHQVDMPFTATERARVYLTNALLGWQSSKDGHKPPTLALPELQTEQTNADSIKQSQEILVILGHPPDTMLPGMAIAGEPDLTPAEYTKENASPLPGSNEFYIRFFLLAERQIVRQYHKGIICYVSGYSWLDGTDNVDMRQRYLEMFDHIWIDSLNGDKYRTGNLTPAGEPDPNVFSSRLNREGSQTGTVITTLTRKEPHQRIDEIKFRSWWGKTKLLQLVDASGPEEQPIYEDIKPSNYPGYSFLPPLSIADYWTWPAIPELFSVSLPGLKISSDVDIIDIELTNLKQRIEAGADAPINNNQVIKYIYRPFDTRYLYRNSQINDEAEKAIITATKAGNNLLICRRRAIQNQAGAPFFASSLPADRQVIRATTTCFPITLQGQNVVQKSLFDQLPGRVPANLSTEAHKYLLAIGIKDPDVDAETAGLLGNHILAIGYAPEYLSENAGLLRPDWPRIPLPNDHMELRKSAALGDTITALLNIELPVRKVTIGPVRPELSLIAILKRVDEVEPDPGSDLIVSAGWDAIDLNETEAIEQGSVVERCYTASERTVIEKGAATLGLSLDRLDQYLGPTTYDIYLNETVYWTNIPSEVWTYTIGGYPVIQTWLSHRTRSVLGRPLTLAEAREFRDVARRLMALVLLGPGLDDNYRATKQAAYQW